LNLPTFRKAVKWSALIGAILVWAFVLRPTWLGGPATYILVRGDSMLPVHINGDFLFIHARPVYGPGDVVAFRVPAGELGEGKLVVHRIVEGGPGGYVLRGDNNSAADPWRPSQVDIVGRVMFAVPMVGRILAVALSPAVAASIATAMLVMFFVARGSAGQASEGAGLGLRRPTILRSTSR
jgi:signal peptidase